MGKYSFTTFGRAFNYEKDEIKHALNGEILVAWDEEGRHWEKASKEETDKVILKAFDYLFFEADQLRTSGLALDRIYGRPTRKRFQKYMKYVEEERSKPSDYEYEKYDDEAP